MRARGQLVVWVVALSCAAVRAWAFPEPPVALSAGNVERIAAAAPGVPADLGLGLDLELVDYIDCTNPADPHPMMDQGTSSITTGPAGRYRVTAQGRNSFFAYRWRAAAQDVPHVLVVEYPDDAKREICFLTHESQLTGNYNDEWSLETGVYTGNPLPVTGKMNYHTLFFWPQDRWPVIIVGNWSRQGAPAAASRIWVFRVKGDHLPAMEVTDADQAHPRLIGDLYNWSLVPVHNIFGRTSRAAAFQHIVEYYQYLGCNVVSWPVVSNNSWGFRCRVEAWGGGDESDELEGILSACDEKGMYFIPTFEIGRDFRIAGKRYADDPQAFRQGLFDGFDAFLRRYGHHRSLAGIAFGTPDFGPPYGEATIDLLRETGSLEEFTRFIHARKPDLKIMTFIGARDLHEQYFEDMWGVLSRWEQSDLPWDRHLADETLGLWKQWGRDPAEFTAIDGLTVVYQYQPDDHGIYDSYLQQPRAMVYYDLDRSPAKSANIDTRAVMLWNTFYESWLGLHEQVNFWYRKLWVAPDFNASQPYANASWSRAMEHRDRNLILSGAWNRKAGGHENTLRQFAKAFRELPPPEMKDVPVSGGDAVKVRQAVWQGKTYVSLLSVSPVEEQLDLSIVDWSTTRISLAPFAMQTLVFEGEPKLSFQMQTSRAYHDYVQQRLQDFTRLTREVRALDAEAAGKQYEAHAARAGGLLSEGKVHAADLALGYGIPAELALRKRLLQPDVYVAGRVVTAPQPSDSLDAWDKKALDINADDGSFLGTHLYFPNSWTGPEDLSARVRMGHDGRKLYVGVKVADSVLHDGDGLTLWFSRANYRNWRENEQAVETLSLNVPAPVDGQPARGEEEGLTWSVTPCDGGYLLFAAIALSRLGIEPGGATGFLIRLSDHDGTPNIYRANWAIDSLMLIPHAETFVNWSDPRTCLELRLGK
jgi:hypothetical protein